MRVHTLTVAAAVAMFVAGCGSTVSGSSTVTGNTGGVGALGGVSATTGTAVGAPGGTGSTAALANSPGGGTTGGSGVPVAGAGGETIASGAAPGVSAGNTGKPSTIMVGVPFPDDIGTVYSAFNIHSASSNAHDFEAMVKAIFAYTNAHGGFGGHVGVPLFYLYKLSSGDFSTQMQAMCSYFTQDHRVFAVMFLFGNSYDPLPACLAQHHTALIIDTNSSYYDDAQLARLSPYYYRPFMASMWALKSQIDGLVRYGLLSTSHKIGVLRWDDPQGKWAYDHLVVPELARYGMQVTKEFAYTPVNGLADASQAANESSQAVLEFRAAGVDRVVTLATNEAGPLLFATAAESQNYRPLYGLSSMDIPGGLPGNAPAAQVANMYAVGWNRAWDLDFNAATPGTQKLAKYQRCKAIERKVGITDGSGYACYLVWWLQAALSRTTSPSAQSLRAAVDTMGDSWQGVANPLLRFAPGRVDGIAAARFVKYDGACSCMAYTGQPFAISP